ncbi:hypothetical protein [Agromyces sp. NPDC058064]|uniref:hypothetical protein n=1 Tax=Agromyces sp. NPDC058064 TaxID=3346322 RepID=UPI0036DB5A9E
MTDEPTSQPAPQADGTPAEPAEPATPATPGESTTPAEPGTPAAATPPPAVSRSMLIWFGVIIVVLSFVAAFLGSWLARSGDATAAAPTPTPTETVDEAAYEEALEEILPAGSAVRAGSGVPEAGKGYDGDVYIDITTSDVYLFEDGDWTLVGNIRQSAAENLTGEQGATGATGAQGEQGQQGEQGEAGAPGTQVLLGVGAPAADTCTANGDVYIDTSTVQFYECAAGAWRLFGPPSESTPAPSEPPAASDAPADGDAPADTEEPAAG